MKKEVALTFVSELSLKIQEKASSSLSIEDIHELVLIACKLESFSHYLTEEEISRAVTQTLKRL